MASNDTKIAVSNQSSNGLYEGLVSIGHAEAWIMIVLVNVALLPLIALGTWLVARKRARPESVKGRIDPGPPCSKRMMLSL